MILSGSGAMAARWDGYPRATGFPLGGSGVFINIFLLRIVDADECLD
jgi:hypothetical protein